MTPKNQARPREGASSIRRLRQGLPRPGAESHQKARQHCEGTSEHEKRPGLVEGHCSGLLVAAQVVDHGQDGSQPTTQDGTEGHEQGELIDFHDRKEKVRWAF